MVEDPCIKSEEGGLEAALTGQKEKREVCWYPRANTCVDWKIFLNPVS